MEWPTALALVCTRCGNALNRGICPVLMCWRVLWLIFLYSRWVLFYQWLVSNRG
jgi:hypothetical protein